MSQTINVLLEALANDAPKQKFDTNRVSTGKQDEDGNDIEKTQYKVKGLKNATWLEAVEVEGLTINNDVARSARIADKGFTWRWVKEDLTPVQVELIALIRFKNAAIRVYLQSKVLGKKIANMAANFTLNIDPETRQFVLDNVPAEVLSGLRALEARPAGMKRAGSKGKKKEAPLFTL